MTFRKGTSVNCIFRVFRDAITTVAAKVVGNRVCNGKKGGNEQWTAEIKGDIERKRRAY